eukprot:306257-Karenia_brevis.AAC.1
MGEKSDKKFHDKKNKGYAKGFHRHANLAAEEYEEEEEEDEGDDDATAYLGGAGDEDEEQELETKEE